MRERLPRLRPAELDEAQRRLYDELVSGPRGRGPQVVPLTAGDGQLEGPFNAMLFAPGTGAPLLALGTAVRFCSSLTPRAREIATLAVAAHSGSAYELYAHERLARQAGLTAAECAALRDRRDPGLADPGERAVLRATSALLDGEDIPDDVYRAAEEALGRAGLVELATLAGYYLTLAMLMRAFRVGAPEPAAGDSGTPTA
jgi:4-carboxymuconolactone decarboxylase